MHEPLFPVKHVDKAAREGKSRKALDVGGHEHKRGDGDLPAVCDCAAASLISHHTRPASFIATSARHVVPIEVDARFCSPQRTLGMGARGEITL